MGPLGVKTMEWIEKINRNEDQTKKILSFQEYMELFDKDAHNFCRTTSIYLKDMFEHFGQDEDGGFKLFRSQSADSPPVHGQVKVQKAIYQNIKNFIEEGYNNKFILLIGPNGSSKSSLIKKIMLAAEEYSKLDHGALFTFSWVFPIEKHIKGGLGLGPSGKGQDLSSYAHLEDEAISAILSSELKDHPLLLIPLEVRRELLNEALQDFPELMESIHKSYLYNGDLSKRNKMIFEALLKNYNGDTLEVLKHIRIERFIINKRYSMGAATIEPQLHVDARLQQITMDKRLASLPPSLQSLNLFSLNGEAVLANRGILEFSDLLKRPIDAFKYLLMTMESRTLNLQGILTELDIFFIGSSNEVHLAAFKQHPDFKSFKGRFNFLRVPYLTNYIEEMKIYQDQIHNIRDHSTFEPHALKALTLWSVMTRLRIPQSKHYRDNKMGEIVKKINPLEKSIFLASSDMPDSLNSEEKQTLLHNKEALETEYENELLYEGKFGVSPREIKHLIYELSSLHKNVTYIEVLEYLKEVSEDKNEYDFLNLAPQGDYHNYKKFIELIDHHLLEILDREVRDCLGLVDSRSYEDYIAKYVKHVTALLKGEKIKNDVTGKYEESDMYFIKEFENNIKLSENVDDFRSHILSKLGAYYLDNPGSNIVYTKVFDDLTARLKQSFRNEQKKVLEKISRNLVFYIKDFYSEEGESSKNLMSPKDKKRIDEILDMLSEKYHYSRPGSLHLLDTLIRKKYHS
jgi:serine protein kinase